MIHYLCQSGLYQIGAVKVKMTTIGSINMTILNANSEAVTFLVKIKTPLFYFSPI